MNAPVQQLVAIMGRGVVPTDVGVAVADDAGLTRGDGCFDATRVIRDAAGARVEFLDRHLDRFAASSAGLGLPDLDRQAWTTLIATAVEAWPVQGEAVLKLIRTRGGEHGMPSRPTELLTITALDPVAHARARAGIAVAALSRGFPADAFADAPWLLGGLKTLSYAVNAACRREAMARGADDALFVSTDGHALEGPTSALIVRVGDQLWTTPHGATGILGSITQQVIFEAAADGGVEGSERLLTLAEVADSDGAWLASSVRGVCPILTLDGRPLRHDPAWSARLAAWAGF